MKMHATQPTRRVIQWMLLAAWFSFGASDPAQTPALQVWKSSTGQQNLLDNGDFELQTGATVLGWHAYQGGFRIAAGEGRQGSRALCCETSPAKSQVGASQTLNLNRTEAAPLRVRGWSKADQVSGSPDSGYSLYVDIVYADGSPLWGQTASFRCGSPDWESRELFLFPEKPVKTLTVYCLFRGHTGRVWFDDISLEEVKTGEDAVLFQGVPVRIAARPATAADNQARRASSSA